MSYIFKWYFWSIVFMQSLQVFFVNFHAHDTESSETTLRYKLGQIFYMIFFFIEAAMQFGTYIFAWFVYICLLCFLKSSNTTQGEMTEFEKRRAIVRQQFEPKFCWLNAIFIYILVILTERTITYIFLRFSSKEALFEWVDHIPPYIYYLTYTMDILITIGVLYFIRSATDLKQSFQKDKGNYQAPDMMVDHIQTDQGHS